MSKCLANKIFMMYNQLKKNIFLKCLGLLLLCSQAYVGRHKYMGSILLKTAERALSKKITCSF